MSLVADATTMSSTFGMITWAALTVRPPGTGICWFKMILMPRMLIVLFGAGWIRLLISVRVPTLRKPISDEPLLPKQFVPEPADTVRRAMPGNFGTATFRLATDAPAVDESTVVFTVATCEQSVRALSSSSVMPSRHLCVSVVNGVAMFPVSATGATLITPAADSA
jgi:hypothetical protein